MRASSRTTPGSLSSCLRVELTVFAALVASATLATAAHAAEPAEPVAGTTERLTLLAGAVTVRAPGSPSSTPLTGSLLVPDGTEVDARRGRVEVTVGTGALARTSSAVAYQGRFVLRQDPLPPAQAHFVLSEPLAACTTARGHRAGVASAPPHRRTRPRSRHLWVSENGGSWGTNGHYASTSVEGTSWLTSDTCRASTVRVAKGVVVVHDLIHGTTVTVTAGQSYTAAKPVPEGRGFVPLPGSVLVGESGGDPAEFGRQVGKHVPVFGYFAGWGWSPGSLLHYVETIHARVLIHLSTDEGYGASAGQSISPRSIARGASDEYLTALGRELASSRVPVYLALLPEMNQANNAYCAFNADGTSRGAANSTAAFRQAWRRAALILRGGPATRINSRLRALGMAPLSGTAKALPVPKLSLMWAPQTAGTPDTAANGPGAYYPGGAYVDIVGTDFYSAFPNFAGLQSLYAAHRTKPFGFNEWAMWRNGDPGFVTQLFAFVRTHRRVALMVYNDGLSSNGPFRLDKFPAARRRIALELRSSRFLAYPPGGEPGEP